MTLVDVARDALPSFRARFRLAADDAEAADWCVAEHLIRALCDALEYTPGRFSTCEVCGEEIMPPDLHPTGGYTFDGQPLFGEPCPARDWEICAECGKPWAEDESVHAQCALSYEEIAAQLDVS